MDKPQKLRGKPLFPIPCNTGSNVAAVEVTIYHPGNQFVITFQPYRREIVGFPAASDAICDEFSDSRPVFRAV